MKKILTFLFMVIALQIHAQNYPITGITITLPANPDANTANWGSGTAPFLISATARQSAAGVDKLVIESKILVTIKKGGSVVCGSYNSSSAPPSNFNTVTKVWSGTNAVSLLGKECTLSPGDYELCVQFFGNRQGAVTPFSEEKCKSFTIPAAEQQAYQGPQLISPPNSSTISEKDAKMPITFRWTPVVPKPKEPVTYKLTVWQLMQGQNGPQAQKANQPILTKDLVNLNQSVISNLITGPCRPPYLCDFVWNVQALNREGKPIGGNNGASELFAFKISDTTPSNNGPTPSPQMLMGGANAEFKIDSAVCLRKENGQFKYHIFAHYSNLTGSVNSILLNDNLSFTGYPANPNPGPGLNLRNNIRMKSGSYNGVLTMNDILESSSGTITNISPVPASGFTPASLAPNSIHNFQFDFLTPTNTPVQFTYYGLVDDALKDKANRNARNEVDSLKYPQCPCSACDEITLTVKQTGEIQNNGNGSLVFSVNLAASPKKVKRIKAELVYFDMKPDDENCLVCNKSSNTFGNFGTASTTNTNFTGGVNYRHSAQFDALGNIDISNGIPIKFSINIPPLVSCCNASVNFCIRYVIAFEDCTVCNTLVCYHYSITGCPKQ